MLCSGRQLSSFLSGRGTWHPGNSRSLWRHFCLFTVPSTHQESEVDSPSCVEPRRGLGDMLDGWGGGVVGWWGGVRRSEKASILPFYPHVPGQPRALVTPWLAAFASSLYPPHSLPTSGMVRLGSRQCTGEGQNLVSFEESR